MELLPHFDVSSELSKDEFTRLLRCENSETNVRDLKQALLVDAVKKNLADPGDALVKRKKTGAGLSVKEKHVDDVWCLVCAIKTCTYIPRVLLTCL